jgi:glycosyltransferase involved in cell wall biosynthesis
VKILLPISLDRWRSPLATLLRACVEQNPDLEFFSYSNPMSEEDVRLGKDFWNLPQVHRCSQAGLAMNQYELVHTASISLHNQCAVLAAKCRSFSRCRYLATINLEVGPDDGKDWRLLQIAETLADGIVAVSEAAATGVRDRCDDRFLGVIPNGFDPQYFNPDIDDDEALPPQIRSLRGGSYALYVGALEPRKHPEIIVELAKRNPEITFVAAGYIHPKGKHFVSLMSSLPNLLWLGHVDRRRIRALMKHAGVFLFPSEREGLALSVIEAMGMGLPVIAQPKSSMPELIESRANGILHDINDVDAWSESLRSYLAWDSVQRQQFLKNQRPDVIRQYAWSSIGQRYGEIYRQMF